MYKILILSLIIPFGFLLLHPQETFAQRKTKVVKVKKEGGVIKPDEQHFSVGKQGKNKNDKVTRKGRRFTNRDDIKYGVKMQKKRDRQLKKRRKNPNKKYTAATKPKTKDAKDFDKKGKQQYKEQKKKDKRAKKRRKQTMRLNRKLSK